MAALQTASKCSRTIVYAALLKRFAPCPQTKSKPLKQVLITYFQFSFLLPNLLTPETRNLTSAFVLFNHRSSRSYTDYFSVTFCVFPW